MKRGVLLSYSSIAFGSRSRRGALVPERTSWFRSGRQVGGGEGRGGAGATEVELGREVYSPCAAEVEREVGRR
jgi:hypothetical protein